MLSHFFRNIRDKISLEQLEKTTRFFRRKIWIDSGEFLNSFASFKDISKNASGYVQPTDTNWSAVTENNKIIGLNAKGPLVKEVQNMLINIGYSGTSSGSITTDVEGCKADFEKCDGIYGKNTKEMVKQ